METGGVVGGLFVAGAGLTPHLSEFVGIDLVVPL
jgi:hypothetical protein